MKIEQLKPNITVRGTIFPEPVQVIVTVPMGDSVKLVYDCARKPTIHPIKDPVRMDWEPLVRIEHYHVKAQIILATEKSE